MIGLPGRKVFLSWCNVKSLMFFAHVSIHHSRLIRNASVSTLRKEEIFTDSYPENIFQLAFCNGCIWMSSCLWRSRCICFHVQNMKWVSPYPCISLHSKWMFAVFMISILYFSFCRTYYVCKCVSVSECTCTLRGRIMLILLIIGPNTVLGL